MTTGEKLFTIKEMAAELNMSVERTRLLVKDEPGVLRIPPSRASKSRRTMYRIPEDVKARIKRRFANPDRPISRAS